MVEGKVYEFNELIATRTPPGDTWELEIEKGVKVEGLVKVLTSYMRKTEFIGHYRLEPLNGKLYAIKEEYTEPPEPEKFNLYGEY